MPDFELRIIGKDLDRAVESMKRGERVVQQELHRGMVESMTFAHGFLARYPPKPQGFTMTFKSEKQRRWFFAALRSGEIEVPYRRTTTLGKRWTAQIRPVQSGIRGVIGNITPYARYVQDETLQAKVHRGRWPTIQQLTRAPAQKFRSIFDRALMRIARRLTGK